jgi:hypothetical protein
MTLIRDHVFLGIVILYLLLGVLYSLSSPIFEPPDEALHFLYVKQIHDGDGLPRPLPETGKPLLGLGHPPLYYAIAAAISAPFDFSRYRDFSVPNPHRNQGFALLVGNKNSFIHSDAEVFPWRGLPLTVHWLRLTTLSYGVIALSFTYLAGLELFRGRKDRARLAVAFMALQPEFIFLNASVHNEPAIIAISAVGVWACVQMVQHGPSLRRAVLLGLIIGLGSLAKITGLGLVVLVTVAMLIVALRGWKGGAYSEPIRNLWRDGFVMVGFASAVCGWWYVRSTILYGDPFLKGYYAEFQAFQQPISFADWFGAMRTTEISYWATFGWFNILAPDWVYLFFKGLTRVAFVGLLWGLVRLTFNGQAVSRDLLLLGLMVMFVWPLITAMTLVRGLATEGGIQGRQFLPSLSAVALLMIIGWEQLLLRRWRWPIYALVGMVLLYIAASLPFSVIMPSYARPATAQALPSGVVPLNLRHGDHIRLLGYRLSAETLTPGETLTLNLYWQTDVSLDKNYSVFAHALGRNDVVVGQFDSLPGLGNYATSIWRPGQIIEDTLLVPIARDASAPTLLTIGTGLYDASRLDLPPLPVVTADGAPASTAIAQAKLIPREWPIAEPGSLNIQFDDNIKLVGFQTDCGPQSVVCHLKLFWEPEDRPSADHTVFIQIWDDREQMAGFDGPPIGGDYPTSWWEAGEVIVDEHMLDLRKLPSGRYRMLVGLYRLDSGQRLPAFDSDGAPLPDFALEMPLTR